MIILTKAYTALKTNVTAASLELPKLEDEATRVEAQRLLWLDQWQNISALQKQLDQAKFDQQIANEITIQKEASSMYCTIFPNFHSFSISFSYSLISFLFLVFSCFLSNCYSFFHTQALARATAVPICICYSTIGPSTTTTVVAGGTTTTTITTKTTTANGTSICLLKSHYI